MNRLKLNQYGEIIDIEGFSDIYKKLYDSKMCRLYYDKEIKEYQICDYDEWSSRVLSKEDCIKISKMFELLANIAPTDGEHNDSK